MRRWRSGARRGTAGYGSTLSARATRCVRAPSCSAGCFAARDWGSDSPSRTGFDPRTAFPHASSGRWRQSVERVVRVGPPVTCISPCRGGLGCASRTGSRSCPTSTLSTQALCDLASGSARTPVSHGRRARSRCRTGVGESPVPPRRTEPVAARVARLSRRFGSAPQERRSPTVALWG